jgi:polyphosphate kinase
MLVRGICAVRPAVPGLSENIRVRSILGRYLEHSRVFAFANDGEPEVFIGSADLMHRNLDRRVEALIRIDDPEHIAELIEMIDVSMADETSSWHLEDTGTWTRHSVDDAGEPLRDIQRSFIARQRRWPNR